MIKRTKVRERIQRTKAKYTKKTISTPFKDDPVKFAATYLKILDKDDHLVPLLYKPAQIEYLANRTNRDLVLKARQLGISTAEQADSYRLYTTNTVRMAVMAHEDKTTQIMRRMVLRFHDYFPDEYKVKRERNNSALATYPYTDSEVSIATMGSKNTGRGGSTSRIHALEIAFAKDAESIMAGVMQGGNPRIVAESTANGAQGWFYERCMEALDGNSDWNLHFYAWWYDPDYIAPVSEDFIATDEEKELQKKHKLSNAQICFRRLKIRELKHLFFQEYAENPKTCFLQSGLAYFLLTDKTFTAPYDAIYDPNHVYIGGLDFGQSNDFTVLSIGDKVTHNQVAVLRINKLAWSYMRGQILDLCMKWGVKLLIAENNAMGSTNIEELYSEAGAKEYALTIKPFETTALTKPPLVQNMREAIEGNYFRMLDDGDQKSEFRSFAAKQTPSGNWTYSAPEGQHDDTVIANCLLLHGMIYGGTNILFG